MGDGERPTDERVIVAMGGARRRRAQRHASPSGERRVAAGFVALVGAGPGDPELLTLKAAKLVQRADAIVYDRLVAPAILALAPRAQKHYVGKARSRHAMPQEDINALLVQLARQGLRVVRLKGGDPFIFGRGGEEMEALAAHGVPFEVVPGISAANGIAASAAIPLTHRDHAQSCVFVTGHVQNGAMDVDWQSLVRPRQTLVVYMGLQALPLLCRVLAAHGKPPETPAAIIEKGTTRKQRIVTGTVATLAGQAQAEALESPTLVIVGSVVAVRERLQGATAATRAAAVLPLRRSEYVEAGVPAVASAGATP
jgi:uroporphyrin-III C-methyltransferase/precorrin-2 dehydrogenase/sirohydrochlorin ferrochelatase